MNNLQLCPVLQIDIDSYDCEDHDSLQEIVDTISTILHKDTRIQRVR
ncbi:hypothetical protein EJF36_06690 [Bacillus sp. HMF5848]|nr:hypothetical protein EJF36_06690 [Bacillus sp. HMF5848]